MPAPKTFATCCSVRAATIGIAVCGAPPARANVITDWDEKAVAAVVPMAGLGGTNPVC